jgi:hypothetical protein
MGGEFYPDCNSVCQDVNSYLAHIGDRPFVQTPVIDLGALLPEKRARKYKRQCSPVQFLEASEKLQILLSNPENTLVKLAMKLQINKDTLTNLARGKQKSTSMEYYMRIMAYGADSCSK